MSIPCSCKTSKSEQYEQDVLRLSKKFAEEGMISTPGKVAAEIQREWIESVRNARGDQEWDPCGGCKNGRLLMVTVIMEKLGLVPEKHIRKMSDIEVPEVVADQLAKVNAAMARVGLVETVTTEFEMPDLKSSAVGGFDCPASKI